MNNRFVDGWWPHGLGVVFPTAVLFAVAAIAAPREADEAVRGKSKSSIEVTRLVTGDPAQINAVVAGNVWPTAILAVNPVAVPAGVTPPNPYPPGTLIIGNELRAEVGGFRAWFNVQVSNWDPNGDNDPPMYGYQVKVDSAGYKDAVDVPGDQPDLAPPAIDCGLPPDDAVCAAAFGESWAKCEGPQGNCDCPGLPGCIPPKSGTCIFGQVGEPCTTHADCYIGLCKAGYTDNLGTGHPDGFCSGTSTTATGCEASDADTGYPSFRWFGIYSNIRPDEGSDYYGGTPVLDIPAAAKGKYTVNLNTDETFIIDTAVPPAYIPTLAETGFVVNIGTGQCCYGLGTPDEGCVEGVLQSECDAEPAPFVFTLGEQCSPDGPDCGRLLGACCETISGECLEEFLEAECQGTLRVWTSGTSCGEAACIADTGACCDLDPSGPCTDETILSDCLCPTCTWHKLQACTEIDCDPTPIPTVSEWGLAIMTLLLLTGAKVLFTRSPVARE